MTLDEQVKAGKQFVAASLAAMGKDVRKTFGYQWLERDERRAGENDFQVVLCWRVAARCDKCE